MHRTVFEADHDEFRASVRGVVERMRVAERR